MRPTQLLTGIAALATSAALSPLLAQTPTQPATNTNATTAQQSQPESPASRFARRPNRPSFEPVFETSAIDNPATRVDAALADAALENRHVILLWGSDDNHWTRRAYDNFTKLPTIRNPAARDFILVPLNLNDPNTTPLLSRFNLTDENAPDLTRLPYLTVLDTEGSILLSRETKELRNRNQRKSPGLYYKQLLTILDEVSPQTTDANTLLDDAIARAQTNNRTVFVHFSASSDPWANKFDLWFINHAAPLLAPHCELVRIDIERNDNGLAALNAITKNNPPGIPYFAVLNAQGEPIKDAGSTPDTFVGYPGHDDEVAHFRTVLEATSAPADTIDAIINALLDDRYTTPPARSPLRKETAPPTSNDD